MRIKTPTGVFVSLLSLVALAACGGGRPEATSQTAELPAAEQLPPGHPPVSQTAPDSMLPTPVVRDSTSLTWVRPPDWADEPPANPMRQAQYRVPGAAGDGLCVVYYFGAGQGGSPQANAERWADQFDQPGGGSSRQALQTDQIEVNGLPALLVEVTGTYREGGMMMTGAPEELKPGFMLLGAVVEGPDANWFFKFTGPEPTVRANANQFEALIYSVQGPA